MAHLDSRLIDLRKSSTSSKPLSSKIAILSNLVERRKTAMDKAHEAAMEARNQFNEAAKRHHEANSQLQEIQQKYAEEIGESSNPANLASITESVLTVIQQKLIE